MRVNNTFFTSFTPIFFHKTYKLINFAPENESVNNLASFNITINKSKHKR